MSGRAAVDLTRELERGIALQRRGRLAEALQVYKAVLAADPGNADALNLLSTIALALGDFARAAQLAGESVRRAPGFFAAHVSLGNALQAKGDAGAAAAAFRAALALNPRSAEAASNLASALNALGHHAEARAAAETALGLQPSLAEAHVNMGNALGGLDRAAEAAASYRRALDLDPAHAGAHYNLGTTLADAGDAQAALPHLARAAVLDPNRADVHYNLANTALALDLHGEACAAFAAAVRLGPGDARAHNNLGGALQGLGRIADAVESFRKAVALEPEAADLHWNLALALLQAGRYEEGWREYEWRWRNPDFTSPFRDFGRPAWDGGELGGRSILLHSEQGAGDAIQFVRYAPLVAALGGRVWLECRPSLKRLFATVDGVERVFATGEEPPPFDLQSPLMSLPRILGTTVATIPDRVPYLNVPAGAGAGIVLPDNGRLGVGFAWAGSPTRRDDRKRSLEPSRFAPLFDVPGTAFFSLQVGAPGPGFAAIAHFPNVADLSPALSDFADTAAAAAGLDVIICVDTALAHLAGALARPAWVLQPFARSYLWLAGRDDSPWYPTLRLFQQTRPGDWDGVLQRVRQALAELAAAGRA